MFDTPLDLPTRQHVPRHQTTGSPQHDCNSHQQSQISAENEGSLDLTQRIERKLAEYNASENVFKRWSFEILSWCVSLVCMAAVVGIYISLKDKPFQDGNLLAYANALSKVASAALIVPTSEALGQLKWNWFHDSKTMWDFEIFDKASRGPWGAIMLLFRTRGRSLAALGAVLIVLLLAIDTFFQQVVSLPTRWVLEDQASMLPTTIRYEPDIPTVFEDGYLLVADDRDFFHVLDRFAYGNGTQPVLFGNGTRPDVPVSCPTSNCTWPLYDTLGVCSQCADVSSYLTFTCLSGRVDWASNLKGGFGHEGSFPNATTCGYYLNATSDSPVLMSGYVADQNSAWNGEVLLSRILPLTHPFLAEPSYGNGSIHFKELRNTLIDVLIVSALDGSAKSVYRNATPVAQECAMAWCVKRMSSRYGAGEYEEEVIETFFNTTAGPWPWVATPFYSESGNGTEIWYLEDIDINVNTINDGSRMRKFGTESRTHSSIVAGFADVFPSSTTAINGTAPPLLRYKTWKSNISLNRQLGFNPWLAPNNISRHMDRWALALTNVVRSAPSKTMFTGNSFTRETFIAIRWAWLAFPFTLLFFSLVFLVSTIVKTSRNREIGIWKTSAMPTLIYSLPLEVQEGISSNRTDSNVVKKRTEKVRIKLLPDRGWRVSGQAHLSPTLKTRNKGHDGPADSL